jgi:hypothetical protein
LLDSPNIGPPPVAHFDVEASFSPNLETEYFEFTKLENLEREKDDIPSSPQTRTMPKSAGSLSRDKALTVDEPVAELTELPLKSGSKRKFSSRDEDDRFPPDLNVVACDFQFECPASVSREVRKGIVATTSDTPREYGRNDGGGLKTIRISKRKVLEASM